MNRVIFAGTLILAGSNPGRGAADESPPQPVRVLSFAKDEDLARITGHDATFKRARSGLAEGKGSDGLELEFAVAKYPGVRFEFPAPQAWREAIALTLTIANQDDDELVLHLRLDDDPSADGESHSRSAWYALPPRTTRAIAFPLAMPDALQMGMREPARLPGLTFAHPFGPASADLGHIVALTVYLKEPAKPRHCTLSDVGLLSGNGAVLFYQSIADRFGQFVKENWQGKVHSDGDLKAQATTERDELGQDPDDAFDEFGGWRRGPAMKGSGFFRTETRGDRWWLVSPRGSVFYSLGVDVVQTEAVSTYVEGRESLFTGLPALADPLARHYGRGDNHHSNPGSQARAFDRGRWFNFYTANLERKYGSDYAAPWRATTLDRFRSWGFNTIGNWSDDAITQATDSHGRRAPYVYSLWYDGDLARIGTASDWWGPLPDPFDPRFAQSVEKWLQPKLKEHRDDPYLVGYFVDNELSWAIGRNSAKDRERFSLAYGVFQQKEDSPAKRAWRDFLEQKFKTVAALNAAWATDFRSWDELLAAPYTPPDVLAANMRDDFRVFCRAYAEQYFRTIAEIIHRFDPHHLYLGARFSNFTEEQVQACAAWCDVVSFNVYAPTLADAGDWTFLTALRKPAIVGEFHFGAIDRGGFGAGLVPVSSQDERAKYYRDYIRSLADHPNFVGAHWFQYVDQPLTGRLFDGENYAVGLVTITDSPYPELVRAAAEVNREVYRRRLAGSVEGE